MTVMQSPLKAALKEKACYPARWAGGPLICKAVDLPAFADLDALKEFQEKTGSLCHKSTPWNCPACGGWHYVSTMT